MRRPGPPETKEMMMHPSDQFATVVPAITEIVDRIEPSQLDDPTPCSEFTVHDVLDHMITLGTVFARQFRGQEPSEGLAPTARGVVPAAEFRDAMTELLAAERSPGAMERTIDAPPGAMDGEAFARFVAFDGLVHGWDLAVATDQSYDLPSEVVAEVDAFARGALTDELRDGDTFATPTTAPPGSGPIDRIAAFSGREVPAPPPGA